MAQIKIEENKQTNKKSFSLSEGRFEDNLAFALRKSLH